MVIVNKNKNIENHMSVKIENFDVSPIIKNFKCDATIEEVLEFLDNLDYDMRSSATVSFYSDNKILILRS